MFTLRYKAKSFPESHRIPGAHLPAPGSHPQTGQIEVSEDELLWHARNAGDPAPQYGPGTRSADSQEWRAFAVKSALDLGQDSTAVHPTVRWLDSSEMTFLSYVLGTTQASLIAERLFGVEALVHVDQVLRRHDALRAKQSRPDLIGYIPGQQAHPGPTSYSHTWALIEAKGTFGMWKPATLKDALTQVKLPDADRWNANWRGIKQLTHGQLQQIVSYAHFDSDGVAAEPRWTSYLEDPPAPNSDVPLQEHLPLRAIALHIKMLPVYREIAQSQLQRSYLRREAGLVWAERAAGQWVGMQESAYDFFEQSESNADSKPPSAERCVELLASANGGPAGYPLKLSERQHREVQSLGEEWFKPGATVSSLNSGITLLEGTPRRPTVDRPKRES